MKLVRPMNMPRRAFLGTALTIPAAAPFMGEGGRQGSAANAVSVFDFIPKPLQAGIVARTVDRSLPRAKALTSYIQTAIDAAAAKRQRLIVPAGLYNIAPTGLFAAESGPCQRCFAIRSHMNIDAEAGASFRLADGVSTDRSVVLMCMFGTNETLRNVRWRGLEMDMNGANNQISPKRRTASLPHNGFSLVNQAQIYVSGTPAPTAAARIHDAAVESCRFINSPGVSCIVMGQSNVVGSGLGTGWVVQNCVFYNNGFDTVDHSTIYGWAENVTVTNNVFSNPAPFEITGGLVAYEVHGANTTFAHNRVNNYYQGMWIDGNGTREVSNIRVIDNVFDRISAFGIMFFGQSSGATSVRHCLIEGNTIVIDDTDVGAVDLKYGIGTAAKYSIVDVNVQDNTVRGVGTTTGKVGIAVIAGTIPGQKHDRWVIKNNSIRDCALGIAVGTNPATGLGKIQISDNTALNLTPMGPFEIPQGISYTGVKRSIDHLIITKNVCRDDRVVPRCAFGIRLEGAIGTLELRKNVAERMTVAPYAEVLTAIDHRQIQD